MKAYALLVALSPAVATAAAAQTATRFPGAVLATHEPHHHLAYEDAALRVLRVRVAPHDTTLLHEHDPDYFWIALGASEVTNAKLGAPDATIKSEDLSIHYAPGNFAHVARNPGTVPFDNITVELLEPQGAVRNLCEPAMAGKPLSCDASRKAIGTGVRVHQAFATNALEVDLVTLDPGATFRPSSGVRQWLIALDTTDTKSSMGILPAGKWAGGVFRAQGRRWSVRNEAKHPVRMLVVVAH